MIQVIYPSNGRVPRDSRGTINWHICILENLAAFLKHPLHQFQGTCISGMKGWSGHVLTAFTPLQVGFRMGNPQVGFSHTVPVPWHTVPATGTTHTRPINRAVSNETRGIHDTCSILIMKIIKIIIIIKM